MSEKNWKKATKEVLVNADKSLHPRKEIMPRITKLLANIEGTFDDLEEDLGEDLKEGEISSQLRKKLNDAMEADDEEYEYAKGEPITSNAKLKKNKIGESKDCWKIIDEEKNIEYRLYQRRNKGVLRLENYGEAIYQHDNTAPEDGICNVLRTMKKAEKINEKWKWKEKDINNANIPKEGEIYDFLDNELQGDYSDIDPTINNLKHLYTILYYLEKQKREGVNYESISAETTAAIDKTSKERGNKEGYTYYPINRQWGLNIPKGGAENSFDAEYKEGGTKKIIELIDDRYGLTTNDRKIFDDLLDIEKEKEGKMDELKVDFKENKLSKPQKLYFPDNDDDDQWKKIRDRVHNSLKNGKHLILVGPPGTGKSKLAKAICDYYRESKEQWKMSTATSDWTTFDTIGGYRMEKENENKVLEFKPGIFLDCFKKNGNMANKWLIIDEINRADIDKAFGALFSALTGDNLTLTYKIKEENVKVIGDPEEQNDYDKPAHFIIPEDWRIIATMNTFDKASLYEMSYAFMRRFAFIRVGIPKNIDEELIREYISCWDDVNDEDVCIFSLPFSDYNQYLEEGPISDELIDVFEDKKCDIDEEANLKENTSENWIVENEKKRYKIIEEGDEELHVYDWLIVDVKKIWENVNEVRPIGPALIKDIYTYLLANREDYEGALIQYVYPQFEGISKNKQEKFIENIDESIEDIDKQILKDFVEDFFRIELTEKER